MPSHSHDPAHICQICHQARAARLMLPASLVRPNIEEFIRAQTSGWSHDDYICLPCLNRFRTDYVREQMEQERGELSALEQEVVESIRENEFIADNINQQYEKSLTLGDKVADKMAEFGGSWTFIGWFFAAMAVWIAINTVVLLTHAFDPYPFILLNLLLSLLAAIQAPIIMMSQNRQEDRDRLRAENDYQVNLKAEIEIRALGEKLDQLLHNQWMRLIEIQQIQMEMLQDISGKR